MTISELSNQLADAVAAASGSIVGVGHGGTGVIVADGLVVTNAHNLREQVEVFFPGSSRETATVPGADVDGDLAVLSVATGARPSLQWRPAEATPRLGEVVIGLSAPGGGALRAGVGFVSALDVAFRGPGGSTVTGALEHTAPLARGSSGGALIDGEGRLLGINTHRQGDGSYLAIPVEAQLKERVEALSRGEVPRRPRLGVALAPPRAARRLRQAVGLPPREGLLVQAVDPHGAAARAGMRPGDLIVSVNGTAVASVDELVRTLEVAGENGPAELLIVRGAEEVAISVRFDRAGAAEEGTA